MFPGPAPDADAANRVLRELLDISRYPRPFIAVCDDIWHGGEDYRTGRKFMFGAWRISVKGLAAEFDVVCEMTAGLPTCGKENCPVSDWIYGFFMAWGMFLTIPCPKKNMAGERPAKNAGLSAPDRADRRRHMGVVAWLGSFCHSRWLLCCAQQLPG